MRIGLQVAWAVVWMAVASPAWALDCLEALECLVDCQPDPDCTSGCLDASTPEALAFVACMAAHQCTDDMCLVAYCGDEIYACDEPSEPSDPGEGPPSDYAVIEVGDPEDAGCASVRSRGGAVGFSLLLGWIGLRRLRDRPRASTDTTRR